MKTSFQRIITEDNLELVGNLYEPDSGSTTILVHVHGMAGNFYENKFLDFIAETLTANGIAFFAFNNRGCEFVKDLTKEGNIVRIGNAYEIFEESYVDIKAAIDFVSSKGFSKVHLSGHSLGSPKAAHYVAGVKDDHLASVILISPPDMVGLFKADKDNDRNTKVANEMISSGKGKDLLPFPVLWDQSFISAQTYLSLGSEKSKVAVFNFHNPNDKLGTLAKIKIPTFAIMGRKDDALVVSIEETMARIEKALVNSPKVKTHVLGDATHGYVDYEQRLADALKSWISDQ